MTALSLALVISSSTTLPDGTVIGIERVSELATDGRLRAWDAEGRRIDAVHRDEVPILKEKTAPIPKGERRLAVVFSVVAKDPDPGWGPTINITANPLKRVSSGRFGDRSKSLSIEVYGVPRDITSQVFELSVAAGKFSVLAEDKIGGSGALLPKLERPKNPVSVIRTGKPVKLTYVSWNLPPGSREFDLRPVARLDNGQRVTTSMTQLDPGRRLSAFEVPPGRKILSLQVSARSCYRAKLGPIALVPSDKN